MLELFSFGDAGWGDDLLRGAWVTLRLAVFSVVIGFSLGLILAMAKMSRFKPLSLSAEFYTLFIRGVPEFLILLFVFFASEQFLNSTLLWLGIDVKVSVPKFTAAIAGLSMIFAAYSAEVFRGAYIAVPLGQIEAAHASGMSEYQVFIHIRVPQLLRYAIPGLGNLWMIMLKDTSLAAVIALDELLRIAKLGGEATGSPLMFFVAAAVLYLLMTIISDLLRYQAEKSARKGVASV